MDLIKGSEFISKRRNANDVSNTFNRQSNKEDRKTYYMILSQS